MITRTSALALFLAAAAAGTAAATEIDVLYADPGLFKQVHEDIAKAFMEAHPDIVVNLRAPAKDYEDGAQRQLRDAITGNMADVSYQGINRLRIFYDRGLVQPMDDLIAAEPDWSGMGYGPALLTLGQMGGKQWGIAFSVSNPIVYYNVDLLKQAGWDPDHLPTTWDEVFALGRKVNDLPGDAYALHYDWQDSGNWMWQALITSHGGRMMDADEKTVTFAEEPGRRGMRIFERFVTELKMPQVTIDQAAQDFAAGRMAMWFHSTSWLGKMQNQVGDRFTLKTGAFPIAAEGGTVPAGGNLAMIFSADPEKREAAWEYVKFATGPVGATIMVKGTGYVPANELPAKDPAMLAAYYAANPNYQTAVDQLPIMSTWWAWPGDNGLKITKLLWDRIESVATGQQDADRALQAMQADVEPLLPAASN